ncbi:hypothetical protein HDU92_006998 [Lobulomyces angularis]|nr:hypothetical protein HDU92_006998 [Lobulomyces angularis]
MTIIIPLAILTPTVPRRSTSQFAPLRNSSLPRKTNPNLHFPSDEPRSFSQQTYHNNNDYFSNNNNNNIDSNGPSSADQILKQFDDMIKELHQDFKDKLN